MTEVNAPVPQQGFKTMLLGQTGTGKTYSLRTLVDCGITPFILFTEPGMLTLGDVPKDKLHWHYIAPANPEWDVLEKNAKLISSMSYESLSSMKAGMNKQNYTQFIDIMATMNNFVDDRTGEAFGPVNSWNTDRCLVVDSLSGINLMAMDLVVGAKPSKHQGEWGVAMDNEERFINKLCMGTNCHFVLTAHLDISQDQLTGARLMTPAALGNKLAPKLPRNFDDVILARKDGSDFYWSTATAGVDLKNRTLPLGDKLPPDFGTILAGWERLGGVVNSTL